MLQSLGLPIEGIWPDILVALLFGLFVGWLLFGREREVSHLRGKLTGARRALADRKRRIRDLEGELTSAGTPRAAASVPRVDPAGAETGAASAALQGQLDQARGVIANFEREVADLRSRLASMPGPKGG